MSWEEEKVHLTCPACGALIEAGNMAELIELSRAHTLDAHNYNIPDQHVRDAALPGHLD